MFLSILSKLYEKVKPLPFRIPCYSPKTKDDLILPVPNYQQTDWYSCGAVACIKLLHFFQKDVSKEEILKEVACVPGVGADAWSVIQTLRNYGLNVVRMKSLNTRSITKALSQGQPVLLIRSIPFFNFDISHWEILYGINRKTKKVYLTGGLGRRKVFLISEVGWLGWAWRIGN